MAARRDTRIEWFSDCSIHEGAICTRVRNGSQAPCQHSTSDITLNMRGSRRSRRRLRTQNSQLAEFDAWVDVLRPDHARACGPTGFAGSSRLDSHHLETSRTSTLDGHRSLRAVKVLGQECDEFLVRPALDGRCFHLCHPTAIRQLRERGNPCVGFDLDADDGGTRVPVCSGQSAPWSAPPRAATTAAAFTA